MEEETEREEEEAEEPVGPLSRCRYQRVASSCDCKSAPRSNEGRRWKGEREGGKR